MGGTEVAILALINKLIEKNHDVTLYLLGNHGELIDRVPRNVEVEEIAFSSKNYQLVADSSLNIRPQDILMRLKRKCIKLRINLSKKNMYEFLLDKCIPVEKEYDLVCEAFGYGRFTTPYAALILNAKKRALWFHDENLHWLYKANKYFKYYDEFFCVSKSVLTELVKKENFISDRCDVLHNFIDTDEIRARAEEYVELEYDSSFNILTIGRLEEQKGIDIAIKTAQILFQKRIHFHWYVIGEGSLKDSLSIQIKERGLDKKITLLGLKKNPYPYLRSCDLYVQPSRHEGYPITLIEARALCCPIVATNIPSISEQIVDGENGFLVELVPEKFAEKIEKIIKSPQTIKKIKEKLFKEKIDFSSDYQKIENLLERIQ